MSIDLDQRCFVVTQNPTARTGPMMLRSAIRRVVDHPPTGEVVRIELIDGTAFDEPEIGAMYVLASLTM